MTVLEVSNDINTLYSQFFIEICSLASLSFPQSEVANERRNGAVALLVDLLNSGQTREDIANYFEVNVQNNGNLPITVRYKLVNELAQVGKLVDENRPGQEGNSSRPRLNR